MPFTLTPTYDENPRLRELVTRLRALPRRRARRLRGQLGLTHESRYTRDVLEPVWRRSRELGFYGIHLPPEHGGQGLSFTELGALKEEVGASGRGPPAQRARRHGRAAARGLHPPVRHQGAARQVPAPGHPSRAGVLFSRSPRPARAPTYGP
ncbi:acyl-CoA dehydrogenase family protein [Nonomuraea dietziae]|uniref:acyl-CoA dehydrogenase family protein n=1 Tax=Nonomuraea dietziae TaxID=65515 RepID=UPI0031E08103